MVMIKLILQPIHVVGRYQINTAKSILDTILSMQPKEGGQRGGETREAVVSHLANDMLGKLPPDYIQHEVMSLTASLSHMFL